MVYQQKHIDPPMSLKVDGAGYWRDAVRSTQKHVVYAWGLNLGVLTLQVWRACAATCGTIKAMFGKSAVHDK